MPDLRTAGSDLRLLSPFRGSSSGFVKGWWLGVLLLVAVLSGPIAAGVARDADGWTTFTPSDDTRIVYVSNSHGDDNNSGLSPDAPIRSIDQGKSLLRDQHPDWLMLKRGDVWTDERLGNWSKSGRSAEEPMRIGAYGEGDRPLLKTGSQHGITAWRHSVDTYSHIAITGLHFQAHTNDGRGGPTGIRWNRPGENLLIEDTRIEGYRDNIVIRPNEAGLRFQGVTVRRSVITDSFARHRDLSGGTHSQGIYAERTDDLLIEENVFDHNGWNPDVYGADPTIYNHNMYIHGSSDDLVVRDNIIARASAHGLQARPGGLIDGNVFLDNAIAFYMSGEGGTAIDNLVLHASDRRHRDGLYRASGIDMKNLEGSVLLRNIVAQTPGYGRKPIVNLDGVTAEANIIYNWGDWDDLGLFLDPERTIATYDELIGGEGSLESFLAGARELSYENWREEYTAEGVRGYFPYAVKGFGVSAPEPSGLAMMGVAGLVLLRRRGRRCGGCAA